jgi:hypothetical protein
MHSDNYPEILLIHANLINSYAMGDVIALFKKRGYRFITLDEAIARKRTVPNAAAAAQPQDTYTTAPTDQNIQSIQ